MVYPKKLKDNKHCNLDCATCALPKENCRYMGHNLAIDEFTKEIKDRAIINNIEKILFKYTIIANNDILYRNGLAEDISRHITKGL